VCDAPKPVVEVTERRNLLDGPVHEIAVEGSVDGGAVVLALTDDDRLLVTPFEGGTSCAVPDVAWYRTLGIGFAGEVSVRDWDPRVPLVDDLGNVHFSETSCEPRPPVLEGAGEPLRTVSGLPAPVQVLRADGISGPIAEFVARTGDGRVVALDPWSGAARALATGVTEAVLAFERLWVVESGSLVLRDLDGGEINRGGAAVVETSFAPDGSEAAYVDADGLFILEPTGDPVLVEADACRPEYLGPTSMAYLSPCIDRRLVVLDRLDGERRVYASEVADVRGVGSWTFFVTSPDPGPGVETLWGFPPRGTPSLVAESADLERIVPLDPTTFLVLVEIEGGTGRLVAWRNDGTTDEWNAAVADFATGPGHVAFLGDFEGSSGTLYLTERSKEATLEVARRVPVRGFRFSPADPILGYLTGFEPESGLARLEMLILATGQRIVLDEEVAEFRETFWPSRGVLYSVRGEVDAGVRFAAVDVDL
jgi:hypothetical protein